MKLTLKLMSLIFLVTALASCAAPAAPDSDPKTIPPTLSATATAQPENLPTATAADLSTPEVTTTPGDERTVTLDDNNKTLTFQAGDHFLLKLGETYAWEVETPDTDVVSRVNYIMAVRGSQGLFTAHQAGQTVLTARGEPLCRKQKPACMIPTVTFQIDIVVK